VNASDWRPLEHIASCTQAVAERRAAAGGGGSARSAAPAAAAPSAASALSVAAAPWAAPAPASAAPGTAAGHSRSDSQTALPELCFPPLGADFAAPSRPGGKSPRWSDMLEVTPPSKIPETVLIWVSILPFKHLALLAKEWEYRICTTISGQQQLCRWPLHWAAWGDMAVYNTH